LLLLSSLFLWWWFLVVVVVVVVIIIVVVVVVVVVIVIVVVVVVAVGVDVVVVVVVVIVVLVVVVVLLLLWVWLLMSLSRGGVSVFRSGGAGGVPPLGLRPEYGRRSLRRRLPGALRPWDAAADGLIGGLEKRVSGGVSCVVGVPGVAVPVSGGGRDRRAAAHRPLPSGKSGLCAGRP
jgi:hypothetical protein